MFLFNALVYLESDTEHHRMLPNVFPSEVHVSIFILSDTASYKMLLGSVLKNTAKDSWGARKSGRSVSLQADSGVGEGESVHLCMLNHNQAGT